MSMLTLEAGEEGENTLKRSLGAMNLITLGIGAVIGAGIFVLTGQAAAKYAGPAVALSFVLAGLTCAFAGLCYAEFASIIPIAGSAYTYGYATLGEFVAWIIGWDLVLEYAFGAATVASGWSGYFNSLLQQWHIYIPPQLTTTTGNVLVRYHETWLPLTSIPPGVSTAGLPHATGICNLIAVGHGDYDDPGDRHQGVGEFQLCDRGDQAGDRRNLSGDRRILFVPASGDCEGELAPVYSAVGWAW
jgi:APA family basic amino acid/polyamine antiporter